jgi:hypothetical protein
MSTGRTVLRYPLLVVGNGLRVVAEVVEPGPSEKHVIEDSDRGPGTLLVLKGAVNIPTCKTYAGPTE